MSVVGLPKRTAPFATASDEFNYTYRERSTPLMDQRHESKEDEGDTRNTRKSTREEEHGGDDVDVVYYYLSFVCVLILCVIFC